MHIHKLRKVIFLILLSSFQMIENMQNEKKKLKETVMKHRKGMEGQLEEILNNTKSFQYPGK